MRVLCRFAPVLLYLLPLWAAAQGNTVTMQGLLVDRETKQPLAQGSVLNLNTGKSTLVRASGIFQAEFSKGHLLAFSATGYYSDTLRVSDSVVGLNSLLVVLKPLPNTLPTATITGQNLSDYQRDSLERRREFLAKVGEAKMPAISKANDLGFGIGINLDRWGSSEKNKRKARSVFDIMEEDAYINYRWTDSLVMQYTGYRDDMLWTFMEKYRPSYTWLRAHTSHEDLVYYINAALKKSKGR
jgi:hypothetical protein